MNNHKLTALALGRVAIAAFAFNASTTSQCTTEWLSGGGIPGTNDDVACAAAWDPDGAGPATPVLVVAGSFTIAGDSPVERIATWDPQTGEWGTIGNGFVGYGRDLLVTPTNDLYCVVNGIGVFTNHRVMHWDGSAWQQLGGTFSHGLTSITMLANGDLVVGGDFTTASGTPANRLARWDGTSWHAFGAGINGTVRSLLTTSTGDLIVGGTFSQVDGVAAGCIASWDGTTWSALGSGMNTIGVDGPYALAELPNGDLVAGGFFPNAGGSYVGNIARWDGSNWHAMGSGMNTSALFTGSVRSLLVLPNGDLVAGGVFTQAGGILANRIARWNGSSWSGYSLGFPATSVTSGSSVEALAYVGSELIAGGSFQTTGTQIGDRVSRWDGSSWQPLSGGLNESILSLATAKDGTLIAGGKFTVAGQVPASRIAQFDGTVWRPLSNGLNHDVYAVTVMPNGDVIAGGSFQAAHGITAPRIARWNGSTWSSLAYGLNNTVYSVAGTPDGDVIAAGVFTHATGVLVNRIARWNGSNWSSLGTGINGTVHAVVVLPDGDIVAAGSFSQAGGVNVTNVARWNGTNWSAMGGLFAPRDLSCSASGELYAASSTQVMHWNGTSWQALSNAAFGTVWTVCVLPNGDVIAGGDFTNIGGVNANRIARWNGTTWAPIGSGLSLRPRALAFQANGELAIGGIFELANGLPSPYFARIGTTCPAAATAIGAGCPGSGGNNELTILERAWVAGNLRTCMTGIANSALIVAVTGFTSTSLPLTTALPQALPGCDLHVTPDLTDLVIGSNGTATFALPIPNSVPLIGQAFYHQHVPFELDITGNVVEITTSNALELTIGAF